MLQTKSKKLPKVPRIIVGSLTDSPSAVVVIYKKNDDDHPNSSGSLILGNSVNIDN